MGRAGLRHGLVETLAELCGTGTSADELAERLRLDPFSVRVWCHGALAAGIAERTGDTECRDIDTATQRVLEALAPGGICADLRLPVPGHRRGLAHHARSDHAGIQYFEAQIDDQLVPRARNDDVLQRNGFVDLGNHTIMPVHALTWARRSA
jgi:hypothetical protein